MYIYRVLTTRRQWSTSKMFLEAEPNSVWNKIWENHMTDDSFTGSGPGIEAILNSNELLTGFFNAQAMTYRSKPCELKILWKSTRKSHQSMTF